MNEMQRAAAQRALKKALKPRGTAATISRETGKSKGAVSYWEICPTEHLEVVSKVSGVPAEELRPDLAEIFGKPPTAAE